VRSPAAAALLGLALPWAAPAAAHVALERTTLRQWLTRSDAALVVEFETGLRTWTAPDGLDRQEYFRVRPLERLAGDAPEVSFVFSPHAEGLPAWAPGERALLFLERTDSHPEVAGLAVPFPWLSLQGPGAGWSLEGAEGAAVLAQARALASLSDAPGSEALFRLRALVRAALVSPWPRLRADARAELVVAGRVLLAEPGEAATWVALLEARSLPLPERVTLLRLLGPAAGFDAGLGFLALTEEASSREERVALVRAGVGLPDPRVRGWVLGRLADPDPRLRRETAQALGRAPRSGDVEALHRAAHDLDDGVSRAAIMALGLLGDPVAVGALEDLRSSAPPPRDAWAAAALRRVHAPRPGQSGVAPPTSATSTNMGDDQARSSLGARQSSSKGVR
jgi:hypothetical protein